MASVSHATSRSPESVRGLTLLEVSIAAFLFVMVFLGITLSLLTEAGRRVERSGLRAGEGSSSAAWNRIRTDAWASLSVAVPPDYDPLAAWYEGPLVLLGHSSGVDLGYEVSGGVLFRVVRPATGESRRADLLRGVETFRWRFLDGVSRSAVLLEVQRSETPVYRGSGTNVPGATAGTTLTTERLVVAPRRVTAARW